MPPMGRVLLAVTLVVLVGGPAAAAPSAARRTATCDARTATMTFVAGKAVVTSADGRTLATATQKRRSISGSCQSSARLGVARHLLDGEVPRGKNVRCPGPGPRVVVFPAPDDDAADITRWCEIRRQRGVVRTGRHDRDAART